MREIFNNNTELKSLVDELERITIEEGAILVKEEFKETENLTLQSMINACQNFLKILKQAIVAKNEIANSEDIQKYIAIGTALVFQLRKLITGETLQFVVAGESKKTGLKEKVFSQDEIFTKANLNNVKANLNSAQIEFQSSLTNLSKLNKIETSGFNLKEQWDMIIKYGFIANADNASDVHTINKNDGMYRKATPDINVFAKFITDKKGNIRLQHYYKSTHTIPKTRKDLNGQLSYDKGWMYQWLKIKRAELLRDTGNADQDFFDKSNTPLKSFLLGGYAFRETVPGIKGGDFGNEQYKMGNHRIITFNNLINILEGGGKSKYSGIIPSLNYLQQGIINNNTFHKLLLSDFTTENHFMLEDFVSDNINDITNQLTI